MGRGDASGNPRRDAMIGIRREAKERTWRAKVDFSIAHARRL
jgi:hypothetical protein